MLPTPLACLGLALALAADDARNVNEFLTRGTPSFVVGTRGDEVADRGVAAQVRFLQGLLFPTAPIVTDASVDATRGPEAWPANPVLYGGAHLNGLLAAVADELPFRVAAGRLEIAGEVYEGDEYRLIAVVPAAPAGERGPGHPNFLLYAGSGTPGVTEINAVRDYGFGFVVADRFGRRDMGRFVRGEGGGWTAEVTDRARRLPWRAQTLALPDELGELVVHRLELEPVDAADAPENEACARGIVAAARTLGLAAVGTVEVYVYPDRRSKQQLCDNGGDGNAEASSGTLHVLPFDAAPGGPMELLVRHEVTHVLGARALGTPGCAFFGEGLAVWVAGAYGGAPLERYAKLRLGRDAHLADWFGIAFHQAPEGTTYPLAGRVVGALVERLGLEVVLRELYPLPPAELPAALAKLGVSVDELETPYRR